MRLLSRLKIRAHHMSPVEPRWHIFYVGGRIIQNLNCGSRIKTNREHLLHSQWLKRRRIWFA